MQSESAAGAHFKPALIFRRQIEVLLFIDNKAQGHEVSVKGGLC